MGVFTNIFGDRTSEKFGDSWLNTYYGRYETEMRRNPGRAPVYYLIDMWAGHFVIRKKDNPQLLESPVVGFVTKRHACLPYPGCAAALALYMLYTEYPQCVALNGKYERRYGELMGEVMALEMTQEWDALNARFNLVNPGAAQGPVFPVPDPRFEILKQHWGVGV